MNNVISVIVPVFKVEKYLDKCIESIVSQTYNNLEIILVEDGSPDRSGDICDEWAKKDARIIVIHQKNAGGGYARNVALERAKGNFIAFVDSDDYIAPEMFEYLLSLLNKDRDVDIAECDYISFSENEIQFNGIEGTDKVNVYTAMEAMKENILDHHFRQLIWNKLYRREVIQDILFPVGKKIDDEFWTYQVIGNANKLVLSDKKLYAYRQQVDSVMHSMSAIKRIQGIEAKCQRHEYIKSRFPELEEDSCFNLWASCIYQGQLVLKLLKFQEKNDSLSYLKEVIKDLHIGVIGNKKLSLKQKIWLQMAKVSFAGTCKIRNMLKIGV